MAGQTLALADAVLKDDYEGPVREQLNNQCKLAMQVGKNTTSFVGRRAVVPLHVSRNTGVGARLEGEVLPAAGAQGTVDVFVPCRYNYGRIRLSKQVITRMASDRGAFVRALDLEMNGIKSDNGRDYNRQLWGTSDGKIAKCGTTTGANVVVLDSNTAEQVIVNLAEGMRIDIGTVAAPQTVAANRLITAVDFTNKTVTIDGAAVTTSSTHFIFRQGAGGNLTNQRELTGLQTMVAATGALFGVDPATYWQWASIIDSNSGTLRPISENLIAKTMMRTLNRSGDEVDLLWAEDGVYRAYANLLQAQKRIVNTQTLNGGHTALEFAAGGTTTAFTKDRDCPSNTVFGLCSSQMTEYVDEDWKWEDLDGAVLSRSTDSTHTFEAIYYKFSEFAVHKRNCHFQVQDLEVA